MATYRPTTRQRAARVYWKVRGRLPVRVTSGPGAGLHMSLRYASANYRFGSNERPVQEVIASTLQPGGVFYDVGANVGFFSLIAGRIVGSAGAVHAFEPVGEIAHQIEKNARRNRLKNVHVHAVAISDVDGLVQLQRDAHPGGATTKSAGPLPDIGDAVTALTLDTFTSSGAHRPPDLVKIDVEGAELEVFAGMERLLRDVRPIVVFELDDAREEQLEQKEAEAHRTLEMHGYQVTALPSAYEHIDWSVRHYVARSVEKPHS